MRGRDLCLVTYDEIAKDYNNVGTFAFIDLHQQTPEKWLASNATQRRCAIRRTEQTAEKSHLRHPSDRADSREITSLCFVVVVICS